MFVEIFILIVLFFTKFPSLNFDKFPMRAKFVNIVGFFFNYLGEVSDS